MGGGVVRCIMIYYVLIWGIKKWFRNYLNMVWTALSIIVLIWYYFFFDNQGHVSLFGGNYFKWCFFLFFMLQGAVMGSKSGKYHYNKYVFPKLLACVIGFYSFHVFQYRFHLLIDLQYLSIIPLLGITYYVYLFCNASFWKKMYKNRFWGQIIFIIGGLCLECYLVQGFFFTDRLNWLFPLNIPIIVLFILSVSYLVNFLSAVLLQTFQKEGYDYRKCFLMKR